MQQHQPITEHEIGRVTHYWNHLHVAGVHLTAPVDLGDHIHIMGHTTDLEQDVGSLQIEHHSVTHGGPGDDIGIRISGHAREHDVVYKLEDEDVGAEQHDL